MKPPIWQRSNKQYLQNISDTNTHVVQSSTQVTYIYRAQTHKAWNWTQSKNAMQKQYIVQHNNTTR